MNFNIQGIDHHHHLHNQNQGDDHDHEIGGSSGTGGGGIRSYDCVYCQRGFTTAQALGGHMNIHRKDRSLATPKLPITPNPPSNYKFPTTISSKQVGLEEDDDDNYNMSDHQVNYAGNTRLFYSSPPKGYFGSPHNLGGPSSFERQFDPFGSGSQGGHPSSGKRVRGHDHSQEEEELDLELRLGHYPW